MATALPLSTSPAERARQLAWPGLLALTVALTLALGWTGFTASDDASYYAGALKWITDPPYAGDNHWTTRYPVVLTFAAAIGIMGEGFAAFTLTALAWYAALVAIASRATAAIAGERAGWIAAILIASMPVVASEATTVGCDLAEASFLLAGAWLIGSANPDRTGFTRPIAAGLCFGLAILCRETAGLALLGFVPLFLLGRPLPRRTLIAMGLATAAVLIGEALFQWALTGDPLRRYALAFNHDSRIDRSTNLEGNLLIHPAIDPLLVLLVNNDFALIFWLALATVASGVHRKLDEPQRQRLAISLVLGASAFLLVALLTTKLVLNPRYFTMPALAAAMLVSIWLDRLSAPRRRWLLGTAIGANLLMLSMQNPHPRWPAEALAQAAGDHRSQQLATDAETLHRAQLPLRFAALTNVRLGSPRPGELYLVSEEAKPTGAVIERYPAPPTPLGRLFRATGAEGRLPAIIRHHLFERGPTMLLLRKS